MKTWTEAYVTFIEADGIDWPALDKFKNDLEREVVLLQEELSTIPAGDFFSLTKEVEYCIVFATKIGPLVGAAVGAWLHARYGRKVRLKIGDIEAEAQTMAEIDKLLAKAQEIQQRNEPKKIHEP